MSKIFTISNTKDLSHKVINIGGLKIKIRNNIANSYKKVLKRLRNKSKIKVIFLATENSKWVYQSLYELFESSDIFEPLVLVFPLLCVHNKTDKTRNNLEENYNFFKSRNINVEYSYKNGEYVDLKEFNPDLVFYEQEWELPDLYKPRYVSQFALTFMDSYGMPLIEANFSRYFHSYLFKLFIINNIILKEHASFNIKALFNNVITGYSKLDTYFYNKNINLKKYWKNENKFKIIYAPHHSFEKTGLNCATFKQNGKFILDLAKAHPETTWLFKPHPRFKFALLKNNIMTEQEIDEYYDEWRKIGNIYEQGDYFDIFKSSNLMITDCCSFLGEYLPTGNPIIRPINKDAVKLNKLGEKVVRGYYQVNNNKELEDIFNQLVIDKYDPKKQIRKETEKYIIDRTKPSAQKIYDYLIKTLKL